MVVLVSYDVNTQDAAGKRRLRRIARLCTSWGQRVQFSVFECLLDNAQWQVLRAQLLDEMDPVSYTHLDVYKRQTRNCSMSTPSSGR